jgi:RNA polymerase sigma factor (sigma-70 family)
MNRKATVFIVDDDPAIRESLTMLLETAGLAVQSYESAKEFLKVCTPTLEGCIILDLNMPEMEGSALQSELARRNVRLPVIFLTGYGNIPTAVRAVQLGAFDFLTKPVDGLLLLERVKLALKKGEEVARQSEERQAVIGLLDRLTEREREVMRLVVGGHSNKDIAQILGISYRTVEIHRSHVMQKSGAKNLVDLVQLADTAGL